RPRLGRLVHGQGGHIADGQLVDHAVTVAVHALSHDLDALHAHLVGGRAADEVADELLRALPLEGLDDQVLVEALDRRGVDGAVAADGDRAVAGTLRRQGCGHRGAGRARGLLGVVPDPLQLRGHLLRESLDGAQAEHVRRVAADPQRGVPGAAGIADHVAAGVSGAVTAPEAVTAVARVGVRAGYPLRDVASPHEASLGVVPDHIRAREAGEPGAVAFARSCAVDGGAL